MEVLSLWCGDRSRILTPPPCQRGVKLAASMARPSTDGHGDAACVAFCPPPPPCALVVPLALLSCSIDAVARRTGGVGIFSRAFVWRLRLAATAMDVLFLPPSVPPDNGLVFSFIYQLFTHPPPFPPTLFSFVSSSASNHPP